MNLQAVCRQLGYSKQAYYKSLKTKIKKEDHYQDLRARVLEIRAELPRLGGRKLHYLLSRQGLPKGLFAGRDRLFDMLRHEGLLVRRRRRYTKTTDSRGWMRQHPNLVKGMEILRPEKVWVADITYLNVDGKAHYLHLITDAYSKKIMGYEFSKTLAATATEAALRRAINRRSYPQSALIHHSDRGLQYCSSLYINVLAGNHIQVSMTQDGSPYDNAIAERINGILKDEFSLDGDLQSEKVARKLIAQAVSLYNEKRPHLSNHFLTPEQMHQQQILKPKAWHKKACLHSLGEVPQAFSTFAAIT